MAGRNRDGPRCSNSWRPSDGPLSSQATTLWRERPPAPFDQAGRLSKLHAPRPSTGQHADSNHRRVSLCAQDPPEQPAQIFKNPNLIPVVPRRYQIAHLSPPGRNFHQNDETEVERLPQIWHHSIDDLIRRTAHDYDLIMNYERDAEGGQRWLPPDIARIRAVGNSLHRDIFALRRRQRVVAQQGDRDKNMMMCIKSEANLLKQQCERVQKAIVKYEQKCEFELLRDGVYAQDDEGNFYKPITPQDYVYEDDYPHNVLQPSIEGMRDDNRTNAQGNDQTTHRDYNSTARLQTPPDTEPSSPPTRNLAFDFAFQATPFDQLKREAADHFTVSHSDRVVSSRIAKPYRNPVLRRNHRSPSPVHCDQSSNLTHSVPSTENIKLRSRGRSNYYERDGLSRRQARENRVQNLSPRPLIGHLGKHKLHY